MTANVEFVTTQWNRKLTSMALRGRFDFKFQRGVLQYLKDSGNNESQVHYLKLADNENVTISNSTPFLKTMHWVKSAFPLKEQVLLLLVTGSDSTFSTCLHILQAR